MQYNHSAEVYDPREDDYDLESNQGRTQKENSDTSLFSNYLVRGIVATAVAYLLYEGIRKVAEYFQS